MAEFERATKKLIPTLEFPPPDCSVCSGELEYDSDGFHCPTCGLCWNLDGESGSWADIDQPCGHRASFELFRNGSVRNVQCHKTHGHTDYHAGYDPTTVHEGFSPDWFRWDADGRWLP